MYVQNEADYPPAARFVHRLWLRSTYITCSLEYGTPHPIVNIGFITADEMYQANHTAIIVWFVLFFLSMTTINDNWTANYSSCYPVA